MPFLVLLIYFLIQPFQSLLAEQLKVNVSAEAAILMNAETGAILYEKNGHQLHYPASITKIATALYGLKLKEDSLTEMITIEQDDIASISPDSLKKSNYTLPAHWLIPGATHMGLKKGEQLSLKDLFYGMMLVSACDASNVIAHFAAGSIPDFIAGLNSYLKEIGCTRTSFYNAHGLFHPKHQTTAYEMALITREAMKNPIFNQIVSTVRYPRPKTNKQESSILLQGNKLLRKGDYFYPQAIGVKTGFISQAEHTFVGAARDKERTLIAVLLKSKERHANFQDAITLFEEAFKEPKVQKVLFQAGPQEFNKEIEGRSEMLRTELKNDIAISYYPAEEPACKCYLFWDDLKIPIKLHQKVGELQVQNMEGTPLIAAPLFAYNSIEESQGFFHFFEHLRDVYPSLTLVVLILIAIFIFIVFMKWRRR